MEEGRTKYLSDEELSSLIAQVEEQELLRAPSYLKAETMEAIARSSDSKRKSLERIPAKKEAFGGFYGVRSRLKLLGYSVQVGVVSAAAIVLLVLFPMEKFTARMQTFETEPFYVSLENCFDQVFDGLQKGTGSVLGFLSGEDLFADKGPDFSSGVWGI